MLKRRVLFAILGGIVFQVIVFGVFFIGGTAIPENPTGITAIFEAVFVVVFQLLIPGFMLLVPEHGDSSLWLRVLATVVDIAIYSLIIFLILWLRSEWRDMKKRSDSARRSPTF